MLSRKEQNTCHLELNSILVVGVARNCDDHIREDILKLEQSLETFKQIHWLIVESDSDDNTVGTLTSLAKDMPSFRFVSCGKIQDKYPLRTERIAVCRNIYLKEIQSNDLYQDVDFVIVADLDGVNNLITVEAINSSFARDDWDVCTANQEIRYYDIWALRHDFWCPNDCWKQRHFFKEYGLINDEAEFAAVYSKMIYIPRNSPWIEVESSFGGLAIYKKQALIDTEYIGLRQDGTEICEHVPLHKQMKEHGCRIFINPKLINGKFNIRNHAYFSDKHNPVKKILSLIFQHVKVALRSRKNRV